MEIGNIYYEKHTVVGISKRTNTVSETDVERVNMLPIDVLDNKVLPSVKPCEDCISRQEVLNLPKRTMKNYFGEVVGEVVYVKDIMELPSVTPQEPKKGRTIDADELLKRIAEKCKIPSLSKDTVNGLCGATAIIYDMLNESGQEK